jgi:hypothetical protein
MAWFIDRVVFGVSLNLHSIPYRLPLWMKNRSTSAPLWVAQKNAWDGLMISKTCSMAKPSHEAFYNFQLTPATHPAVDAQLASR